MACSNLDKSRNLLYIKGLPKLLCDLILCACAINLMSISGK